MNLKWLAIVAMLSAALPLWAQDAAQAPPQEQLQAQGAPAAQAAAFASEKEKDSYVIGVNEANNIKQLGLDLDLDQIIKGFKDAYQGNTFLISKEEMLTVLTRINSGLKKNLVEKNKKEADEFLLQNKAKEGVTATASGLQYQIVTDGTGAKPTEDDTVVVDYTGTLINGTEIENTKKRGKPVEMTIKSLIPGWQEALKLMPVGSTYRIYIPPDLAYGETGNSRIPPNTVLIFEVELLSIKRQ